MTPQLRPVPVPSAVQLDQLVLELMSADDCALNPNTDEELQYISAALPRQRKPFGTPRRRNKSYISAIL